MLNTDQGAGSKPAPDTVVDRNYCRLCGGLFQVTQAMVDSERDLMPPEYGLMTDRDIINIIECCPPCAGAD